MLRHCIDCDGSGKRETSTGSLVWCVECGGRGDIGKPTFPLPRKGPVAQALAAIAAREDEEFFTRETLPAPGPGDEAWRPDTIPAPPNVPEFPEEPPSSVKRNATRTGL